MLGGMQDWPLRIMRILDHAAREHGTRELVSRWADGSVTRTDWTGICRDSRKLAQALERLGIKRGDRVATLGMNHGRHAVAWYGTIGMGGVIHTINPRLFDDQLAYIANHAEDRMLFYDAAFAPIVERMKPQWKTIEHFVCFDPADGDGFEALIAPESGDYEWVEGDEREPAMLCYTSGTTGNPKGVLYSHKSNVLHSFGACLSDAMGLGASDRMLPIVPMFHANAWGIPYAAGLTGCDLVMPNKFMQAEPIAKAIEAEKVTISAAVPTIWADLLNYANENSPDLSSVTRVICGGAAVPLSLMQAWEEQHGLRIIQAWGMTETSPLGSVARPPAGAEGDEHWEFRAKAGRINPLVEARLIDDEGSEVPWDGESTGELEVRGPWIASDYYNDPSGRDKFDDGWLRTGDIASIDSHGFIRISDRSKDVIKSGGEWISSVDLEGELMAHPAVAEAAVIAKPDEKWTERPLACVVLKDGEDVSPSDLCDHLQDRVAKWWVPDEFAFIDEVPKTSVGKFDKKVLRKRLEAGELDRTPVEA
jgi:fatty-acyl-CoA synthase